MIKVCLRCFFIITLTIMVTRESYCTVGSPAELVILGWHHNSNKIFFSLYDSGEGGCPADLIIYNRKTNHAVRYETDGEICDYSDKEYDQAVEMLLNKNKLKRLRHVPWNITGFRMFVKTIKEDKCPWGGYPETKVTCWDKKVTLYKGKKILSTMKIKVFSKPNITVLGVYETLNKRIRMVIFRYLGVPWEGGYTADEVMFIPPARRTVTIPKIYTLVIKNSKTKESLNQTKSLLRNSGIGFYTLRVEHERTKKVYYSLRKGYYLFLDDAKTDLSSLMKIKGLHAKILRIRFQVGVNWSHSED